MQKLLNRQINQRMNILKRIIKEYKLNFQLYKEVFLERAHKK